MAAEAGNGLGQGVLGILYETGLSVPKDQVKAYMWLNLAATSGNEYATNQRNLLEQQMTHQEIAEAQKLSRDWKPKIDNNN